MSLSLHQYYITILIIFIIILIIIPYFKLLNTFSFHWTDFAVGSKEANLHTLS